MAFSTITTSEITTGEPVSSLTQTKIKDNFDSHESRLQTLEGGDAASPPPIIFRVDQAFPVSRLIYNRSFTTVNFSLQITGARLIIDRAGTSGNTEIDLKLSTDGVTWTSIFTTKPLAGFSGGNFYTSTNAVINGSHNTLAAGNFLRLDIISAQPKSMNFIVRIDYERT